MIGIFALLAVAMLLVVKLCKNTLKIVLSIIIILLTLYTVMVSIDINRVESFREPIFAISSELRDYENHSKEVYSGMVEDAPEEVKKLYYSKVIMKGKQHEYYTYSKFNDK